LYFIQYVIESYCIKYNNTNENNKIYLLKKGTAKYFVCLFKRFSAFYNGIIKLFSFWEKYRKTFGDRKIFSEKTIKRKSLLLKT